MQSRLTRRRFIQKAISIGSTVSVAGVIVISDLRSFEPENVACNNCGFQEKRFGSAILQNLLRKRFCPHCGIDTYTSSFPSDKRCACNGTLQNTETLQNPMCCHVPFPAHGLVNSTKPVLRMADLQF